MVDGKAVKCSIISAASSAAISIRLGPRYLGSPREQVDVADETGGDGVCPLGYLDGAPLADPSPVFDVFRHCSRPQGLNLGNIFS